MDTNHDTSRRTVLKGGALGAGALLGAAGLPGTAHASTTAPDLVGRAGSVEYFVTLGNGSPILATSVSFGSGEHAVHGRAGRGEPSPSTVTFTAPASNSSPTLFLAMLEGKVYSTVQITIQDVGTSAKFVKIELSDAVISSYRLETTGDEAPIDAITLSYEKISYSYAPFDAASGQLGKYNTVVWNARTNKIHL
ncbi:MAG TPA: type VI secretion system tube protein Hcp [Mycobacteriales bacterium]|nr:type VI secretion system tube protein Hcp [Mycobacteriales bacterium]